MVIRMKEIKLIISGYILKVELTGFANGLDPVPLGQATQVKSIFT